MASPKGSEVEICDLSDGEHWARRWKSMPGWSVFHGSNWSEVLRESYGFSPCHLKLGDAGMLPLMEARSALLGRRGVSLPFTDTCPPLCRDSSEVDVLVRGALALARRRRWRYLELRGVNVNPQYGPASLLYHEHSLDLPTDPATLFSRFKPELRTAVRKARKSGLQVEMGTGSKLIEKFYRLHSRTRQRQGLPMQPHSFFRNIQRYLLERQSGMVAIASRGDQPVAGAVFLHSETSAIFKFGTSDPAALSLRPNNLLMWEAMQWYIKCGMTTLHLGRTSVSNEGLRRFKLSWGAAEQPLCYYRFDPSTGRSIKAVDRSSAWASNLFRLLPLPVLQGIGRLFYRHID